MKFRLERESCEKIAISCFKLSNNWVKMLKFKTVLPAYICTVIEVCGITNACTGRLATSGFVGGRYLPPMILYNRLLRQKK